MATRKKAKKKATKKATKKTTKKVAAPVKPVAAATAPKKERKFLRDVELYDERMCLPRHVVAVIMGVTNQTFEKWPLKPVWKEGQESFYNIQEAVEYRYGHEGGRLDPGQEKAMLDKIRREQAELELKKKRGDVFEIKPLLESWERVLTGVRQKLYSLPVKLAKPLSMINNPQAIKAEIETNIDECLVDAEDFVEGLREKEREFNKRKRNREAVRRHRANSSVDEEDTEATDEAGSS